MTDPRRLYAACFRTAVAASQASRPCSGCFCFVVLMSGVSSPRVGSWRVVQQANCMQKDDAARRNQSSGG